MPGRRAERCSSGSAHPRCRSTTVPQVPRKRGRLARSPPRRNRPRGRTRAARTQAWRRRTRKVSNRVLVYADNRKGEYLLIYVLNEPDAHSIAAMQTVEDAETMAFFAQVAEAFRECPDFCVRGAG